MKEKDNVKNEEKVEPKLKTVEDLDKVNDVLLKELPEEKTPFEEKYNQLKIDFEKLQQNYTKALEENNKLFQRLTSAPTEQTENALESLLKLKGK